MIRDTLKALFQKWTWQMAWRDSRRHRARLLLYLSSIVLGVAALVALRSFGMNVQDAVDSEARSMLGADLMVRSRQEFPQVVLEKMQGEKLPMTYEQRMFNMARIAGFERPLMVQLRVFEGPFPYYGKLEMSPSDAFQRVQAGEGVLVDDLLLQQTSADIGDEIRLGKKRFTIVGRLKQLPGEVEVFSSIAPRVIMPMQDLPETGLVQFGSRIFYRYYFKYPDGYQAEAFLKEMRELGNEYGLSVVDIEDRKESIGRGLTNFISFLGLIGIAALLLGGIGVASCMYVYVGQKLNTVATLRCIGCPLSHAYGIYLIQAIILGFIGAVMGVLAGILIQFQLPAILGNLLPVPIVPSLSWPTLALGFGTGLIVTLLFTILPLLTIRYATPLAAFRLHHENSIPKDPMRFLIYAFITICLWAFTWLNSHDLKRSLIYTASLLVLMLLLIALSRILVRLLRMSKLSFLPYVVRQGIANLQRPGNQTGTLIICLGLGTFLIMTLLLSKNLLLGQLNQSQSENKSNAVIMNIQSDEIDSVKTMLAKYKIELIDQIPIVSMRLESLKGKTVEELRKPKAGEKVIERWILNRSYQVTFRNELKESEKLIAGDFVSESKADGDKEAIPVSISEGLAKDMGVWLGDELVFNVQGILMKTKISSVRKVDWVRMEANFFIVFPEGPLNDAPQNHVMSSEVSSQDDLAQLMNELIEKHPQVSIIDLRNLAKSISSMVNQLSYGVQFMAWLSIFTGIIVLFSSLAVSRLQRQREAVLFRMLGARREQIHRIALVEYVVLALVAVNSGILLSLAACWAVAQFVFHTPFMVDYMALIIANVSALLIIVISGFISSFGKNRRSPLELLRGL